MSNDSTVANNEEIIVAIPVDPNMPPPPPTNLPEISPIVPELQHLAAPPPPPPAPSHLRHQSRPSDGSAGIGMVPLAIEPVSRGPTPAYDIPSSANSTSSYNSRGGRNTQDSSSTSTSFSRMREKMRSASRNRAKSPANTMDSHRSSPYESIARVASPPYESISRVASPPYESISRVASPPYESVLSSRFGEPHAQAQPGAPQSTERHPREIAAGMTPEMMKLGFTEGGMI